MLTRVQAYLQWSQRTWIMNECHNPEVSPTGELPLLRVGGDPVAGVANIIESLKGMGSDIDASLSSLDQARSIA